MGHDSGFLTNLSPAQWRPHDKRIKLLVRNEIIIIKALSQQVRVSRTEFLFLHICLYYLLSVEESFTLL